MEVIDPECLTGTDNRNGRVLSRGAAVLVALA
jgi:hypothetical protein